MFLSDRVYDTLKWVAQYALPGFATLYFAVSGIWGLPHTEQIVGSIVAVNVFVGALLGVSNVQYTKATNNPTPAPPTRLYDSGLTSQPENLTFLEESVPVKSMDEQVSPMPPFIIPGHIYDLLKWAAMILVPATGTLYYTLATLWGWPYAEQIMGTVAALTIFLGVMLGVSSSQYRKLSR